MHDDSCYSRNSNTNLLKALFSISIFQTILPELICIEKGHDKHHNFILYYFFNKRNYIKLIYLWP